MNNKLSRNVVSAIMAGNEQQAGKIFERAMAENLKTQIEDFKAAVGARMFESADEIGGEFMPVKRDFTIHAVDPTKKSDRFPEGEPVQYKTNAYSPRTAYRNAVASGHVVNKVVDAVGNEVTSDAKIGMNESADQLSEGMRIVSKHGDGQHTAKVYKDTEWGEYRVKFFKDGKHVGEDADYHTDDIDDAKDTADSQIKRYSKVNESTADDVEEWKQKVKAAYPDHADKIKFKSADQGSNIDASHPDHPDRSFGVYDVAAGKGHVLSEDTAVGNIDAQITAQKLAAKKQENAEESQEASKSKAPTINDVVSILGNTVSVADTSAVN